MTNVNFFNRFNRVHQFAMDALPLRFLCATLFLLTLGVGQMWADDKGFYEVYMVYDKNGSESNYTYNGSNGSYNLGTITSTFKIKKMYLKVWDSWSDQAFEYGQSGLGYKTQSGSTTDYKTNTRTSKNGNNYELQHTNMNLTIASYTDPSGSYTFEHWWFADGTWTSTYYLKNGSSNCTFTYKINPPAVDDFAVTPTSFLSGDGSSGNPYVVTNGSDLVLTVSGDQAHTDANSSAQYYNTSSANDWSTTASKTISNVTSTTKTSVTVQMRYKHKTESLNGTESSATIWYKAAPVEAKHTVDIYRKWGSTTLSSTSATIGETNATNVTAPDIYGYEFSTWELGSGISNQSANLTANPISVKTLSSGTYSMTAKYNEVLTSTWYVSGQSSSIFGGWASSGRNMSKKTGYAGEKKYYYTIEATKVVSGSTSDSDLEFKIYNSNGSVYRAGANGYWVKRDANNTDVSTTNTSNMQFRPDAYGTYEFKLDCESPYSETTPHLTVTFGTRRQINFGKGTGGSTVTAKYKNSVSMTSGQYVIDGSSVTFAQTAAGGYDFSGWYTQASGGTLVNSNSSFTNSNVTGTVNAYAQYTPKTYSNLTLNKNGGSADGKYSVTYKQKTLSITSEPTKTGYEPEGYYTNSACTLKVATPAGALQASATYTNSDSEWTSTSSPALYTKWKANTYTITLHDNNGGSHNGTATATYDSNKLTSITAPTRTGYHLVDGYYKESGKTNKISDLSGNLQASTDYTTSGSLWKSTSNQTLYAKWAANTYTIAFNANDGQYVGTATGSTSSVAATYGVYPTLTSNGFSREGYTFAGWATSPTGSVAYSNGQTLTTNLTNDNNVTVTLYAKWTPKEYTVSFNARGGSGLSKSSMTVTMGSNYGTLATVTPPAGKVFSGWYTSAGGGTLVESTTQVTTASDHTLYAHYEEKAQVYFKNTLGWSKVYVVYDASWDGSQGTGSQGKTYREMTLVPGTTDVYYDDIPDEYLTSWRWNIAFNNTYQNNYYSFNSGEAVFRYDFDKKATMFVPTSNKGANVDGNFNDVNNVQYRSTGYTYGTSSNPEYTSGYWRTYNNPYSGYTMTYQKNEGAWSSGHKMESASGSSNVFVYTVHMDANSQYNFAFYKERDVNTKCVQFNYRTQITSAACTNLKLVCNPQNAWMQTTVEGDYTFKLELKNDGHMYLTVVYPFGVGDYRVRYDYTKGGAQHYYSEIIKGRANGKDTISVFIHSADSASSRVLKIEKCTTITSGSPSWDTNYATITLPEKTAAGQTYDGKTTSGVYNFIISQNGNKAASGAFWKKYDGNYYIRTDVADGGWDLYKYRPDNLMTLSEYSLTQTLSEPFSHYYCRFIESTSANITYTIATDYSPGICPVMTGDATIGNAATTLPASANVRFSWNEETNKTRRAYLKNAQNENTRFLVLHGKADGQIFNNDASGTAIAKDDSKSLAKNELLFADLGNWIYQVELKAVPGAEVSLIARYNGDDAAADRYLIGSASSHMQIMGGSGSTKYEILAVYDFKTNRLMTVWKPGGDITQTLTDVDVLLIRHAQEAGKSITFAGGSLKTNEVYGALEFRYDELVGYVANWTSSSRPLMKFFISFPFDVNVSDIFGLNSAYGDAYVIQKYDGAERAEKGFFGGDGTKTFWKDLEPGDVMNANEGYCVIMDNDYLNNDIGSIWENKGAGSKVYLYFPSAGNVGSITSTSQTITLASHECKHDRTFVSTQAGGRTVNHKNTDSHWNMMGVPIFANTTDGTLGGAFVTSGEDGDGTFKYFYTWNSSNNKFAINTASGYTFNSMHGYMVQYYGNVTFTGAHPAASVAARRGVEKENYQVELQILNSNADMLNRTYVELRENACDTFALNEDVYMAYNKNVVDIFTFAGNYDVAANVLSLGNHIVEVGVEVTTAGTYTFSMPSSFSGTVTLIDKVTGDRTNLALDDYEVRLEKGSITDRFLMEINIENVPSTIDGVNGEGSLKDGKAHKFLENGIMYILHNNRIYNANGMLVE